MASNDNLSFSWELRGNVEQQLRNAIKDTTKLDELLNTLSKKELKNFNLDSTIRKNADDATKALMRLFDAREKLQRGISNGGLLGQDTFALEKNLQQVERLIYLLQQLPEKASVSKGFVKNMLSDEGFSQVMSSVKYNLDNLKNTINSTKIQSPVDILAGKQDSMQRIQQLMSEMDGLKRRLQDLKNEEAKGIFRPRDVELLQNRYAALKNELDGLTASMRQFGEASGIYGGLGHIKGYTGPKQALDDRAWEAAKREAEVREVAIAAAERHKQKLAELNDAFERQARAEEKLRQQQVAAAEAQQRSAQAAHRRARASAETERSLRKEAEEVVRLRLEMLKAQAVQLQGIIKNGKGTFDTAQLEQFRSALRDVVREMTTLKAVMSNAGGFTSKELSAFGNLGKGTNNVQALIGYGQRAIDASRAVNTLSESERQFAQTLTNTNASLLNHGAILNDLKLMATQYLSLWGAKSFIDNIIETGGLLEQQRLSIGAILGDINKANDIFGQIKDLAIQSPFGVVELDKMSKQLTAYGFQYNELFDWTKRLADISAATGTEVSRLALALGHVRSEGALSGYTLRQFAMGNIPLLKKLSERLNITTKEVRDRTRKKEIGYDEVQAVLRELTDEGGMFYNAQETMSKALNAKFKNLRDAFDIMYGEIAESGVGDLLKGLANTLTSGAKQWQRFGTDILSVAAAFGVVKLATATYTKGASVLMRQMGILALNTRAYTAEQVKELAVSGQITRQQLLQAVASGRLSAQQASLARTTFGLSQAQIQQVAMSGKIDKALLGNAMATSRFSVAQLRLMATLKAQGKSLPALRVAWMGLRDSIRAAGSAIASFAPFAAIWAVTDIISNYNQKMEAIENKANELKDTIKSRINDLSREQNRIEDNPKPTDSSALQVRIGDMKQTLANSNAYTKTLDEQIKKAGSLSEQYDILSAAIKKGVSENKEMLGLQDNIAEMIKATTGDFWGNSWKEQWDSLFNDTINENLQQTFDSYKELRGAIDGAWEYKNTLQEVIEEMLESSRVSEMFKEQMRSAPFEEQLRMLAESGYWEQILSRVEEKQKGFSDFADNIKEASNGVTERWDEIANDDIPKMLAKEAKRRKKSEEELKQWCLDNIDDFKMMLDGINDQLGIKEPAIRKRMKLLFYDYVRLSSLAGLEAGNDIGMMIADGDKLQKLLKESEQAELKDTSGGEDKGKDKNKGKGSQKDSQLEEAKTKLSEYKAFLSEYKKYREMYSKEKAIDLLEQLFPNLKGQGLSIVDDYVGVLGKLRDSLPATTEARKKFINDIDKTTADTRFDREKEALEKNINVMDDYIKTMSEKWKLYYSLLNKSGGNVDFARLAFTDNGEIWDKTAKDMLATFNQKAKELGVVHVGFRWDMNEEEMREALVDADGEVRGELVKLAQEIQKVISGNYNKFLEESADALNKSLTAAQKLAELERQRQEKVEAKAADNDKSPTKQRGWDAQIGYLDKQIAEQRWDAFKETEQWGRIFSDLDNISTKTLENMLEKLRELAPSVKDDVDAVKALYEAIDKIEDKLNERSPFAALSGSLGRQAAIRNLMNNGVSDLGFRNERGNYTISNANAKKLGLAISKSGEYTDTDLGDGLRGAEKDFAASIKGIGEKFKAVQDVLQPVINLFDTLGNEDLSNFFSMGSNALGAAAQTAQGLSALGSGLGNLGPYGAAAAAALSVVSSIAAMHDKSLQKEIEASESRKKEMENLTKNLETALERSLQGAYGTKATGEMLKLLRKELTGSFLGYTFEKGYISEETKSAVSEADKSRKYYDAAYASLLAQRDETQHQMDLERAKKDSDSDKIADYKQELIELDDQVENFALDMAKSLYDIDVKSWAQELGDALFDAWQKGEDGADAFRKKAGEMIAEVVKSIYAQNLIGAAMSNVEKYITKQMKLSKGELDAETFASGLASELDTSLSNIQRVYTSGLDAVESEINKYGMTMKGESESSSSTTSGIKSITETTADLLASYINAIRADVSVNRETLSQMLYLMQAQSEIPAIAQSQLVQLEQIASSTRWNAESAAAIYDLLHSNTIGMNKFNFS